LADQLTKPLTRIYYYNEQLKEIEKTLPANSPGTLETHEAIQKFTEMVDFFQKNVDDSINLHKVNNVAENLIGCPVEDLSAGGRKFIREGELSILDFASATGEKKTYKFFLFSDLLIYASQLNKRFNFKGLVNLKKASVVTRSQRFSVAMHKADSDEALKAIAKEDKKSKNISIGRKKEKEPASKVSGPQSIKNAIQIMSEDGMLSVVANTFEERDEWRHDLEELANGYYLRRVFGIPLDELLSRQNGSVDGIPIFIKKALEFIQTSEEALKTEGVFRISAGNLALESYKETIDSGNEVDFNAASVHVVCNLIKTFFRELPEPVIPYNCYEECINTASDKNNATRFDRIRAIMQKMPKPNKFLYQALIQCLGAVAANSRANKMTASNLGLILEPNVLKKKLPTAASNDPTIKEIRSLSMAYNSGFVEDCIVNYDVIFGTPQPKVEEKPVS